MDEQLTKDLFALVVLLAIAVCAATWLWIVRQSQRKRPVAPYQPRRPVPWCAMDLVLIVAFYLALPAGIVGLAGVFGGPKAPEAAPTHSAEGSTTDHVVGQLIEEGNVWILLLCGVSAVVMAPAIEEFFFRVLLQGWLEAVEHRWRRRLPTLRRLIPRGVGPIVLTALLFAWMHFRVETPRKGVHFLVFQQVAMILSGLLAMAFAVGLLRWRAGATAADLGWVPAKVLGDLKIGLTTLLAVAVPVYALQVGLRSALPSYIAPDPFPLFFLALALGILYYRTHRIAPLFALHAMFNATSLALVWLAKQFPPAM